MAYIRTYISVILFLVCVKQLMMTPNLTISAWNVRGAMSSINHLCNLMKTSDVIFISEHWLTGEHTSLLHNLDTNFKGFVNEAGKSTSGRNKGGIAFLVRKGVHVTSVPTHSSRLSVIQTYFGDRLFSVIGCHLPSTNDSLNDFDHCLAELFDIYDELEPIGEVIICGDMNANPIKSETISRSRNSFLANLMRNRHLVSVFDGTLQLNHVGPTHTYHSKDNNRNSLIDHFIVSKSTISLLTKTEIDGSLSFDISDHYPISIKLCIGNKSSSTSCGRSHIKWKQCKAWDIQLYEYNVTQNLDPIWQINTPSNEDIELLSDFIVSSLHNASEPLPTVKPRRHAPHSKPYWKSAALKVPHNEMVAARNNWLAAGRPRCGDSFVLYKARKKSFRAAHRRAKNSH